MSSARSVCWYWALLLVIWTPLYLAVGTEFGVAALMNVSLIPWQPEAAVPALVALAAFVIGGLFLVFLMKRTFPDRELKRPDDNNA